MTDKFLVTYATRTGSTIGVAEAIAKTLSENGMQVHLQPLQNVNDLTPYRGLIICSAVQDRQWLPEAIQFLLTHHSALSQKPVAMFTLCMTLAMKNGQKYRPDVMEWLAPVRRIAQPVSEGLFAGVLDIGKIPSFGDRLKFRLSVLFGIWSEGDHRDWVAINTWARALSSKL